MHTKVIAGVTAFTLFQSAFAGTTIVAAIIGATGAIIGGALGGRRSVEIDGASFMKRQGRPEGVPQEEYDRCSEDIAGASVTVAGPEGNNGIRATGIPASCMNLATVLVGNPVDGPYPEVCGSDCLYYNNLSEEQYDEFLRIFQENSA